MPSAPQPEEDSPPVETGPCGVCYDPAGQPISFAEWVNYAEAARVVETVIGDTRVATIYTGCSSEMPPLIYETLVSGGPFDRTRRRYRTHSEALCGHDRIVAAARNEIGS